jgi:phosphoribosylanthranilate isomerase
MTTVKICGITNADDARVAVDAGADMLGFIFYPPSPRYVFPDQVRLIVETLPSEVVTVGVFVNETASAVSRVVAESGVQMAQLHGEERPEVCDALPCPVIKAFRFTAQVRPEMMGAYAVDAFLIEGFHADFYGGAGARADWHQVPALQTYGRLILAGGLTPENVQEAIRIARPYGVDVGSGVEAAPGKKDWRKVRDFVHHAKAWTHV